MLALTSERVRPPQDAGGHLRVSPAAAVTAGHLHEWLRNIQALPDLRLGRVAEARRGIITGRYDEAVYLDQVVDALMGEGIGTSR
ncbi:MAG: hypothetical protein JXA69_00870 [Phycisphaerae bacterium]|nr:hypothetical protein [Phycisphaerae bacterium]